MHIYIDMDEVVADFIGYANQALFNNAISDNLSDPLWQKLRTHHRLYRDLAPLPDADRLVKFIKEYESTRPHVSVAFLTAVPRRNDMQWAFYDKVQWAQKYFPGIPVFFGPFSKDKWSHCKPGDILIDDRFSNCTEWTNAGGLAHQYRKADDCIAWLKMVLPQ